MKIYIAGKISGLEYHQAYLNFMEAENICSKYGTTVNPVRICKGNWSWLRCMIVCIWYLVFKCNAIYLQNNWTHSKGAKIEVFFAVLTNKKIISYGTSIC